MCSSEGVDRAYGRCGQTGTAGLFGGSIGKSIGKRPERPVPACLAARRQSCRVQVTLLSIAVEIAGE